MGVAAAMRVGFCVRSSDRHDHGLAVQHGLNLDRLGAELAAIAKNERTELQICKPRTVVPLFFESFLSSCSCGRAFTRRLTSPRATKSSWRWTIRTLLFSRCPRSTSIECQSCDAAGDCSVGNRTSA